MPWRPNVTVAAVIEAGGRFLMVEEVIGGRRVLNQPAGHLEAGETLAAAVCREVAEETCRPFHPEGLTGVYLYEPPAPAPSYLRFGFFGSAGPVEPGRVRDPEIAADHWLAAAELRARSAELRSPLVLMALEDYLAGRRLPLAALRSVLP